MKSRPPAEPAVNWGYRGTIGPEHWGDLAPEFAPCKLGRAQSPVNLAKEKIRPLDPLTFALRPAPLRLVNDGHTIRADYPAGSFLTAGRERYELDQLHFHRPAGHHVNGRVFAMEAHAVFHDERGQRAVLAIFLDDSGDIANAFVQTLWAYLPEHSGTERSPPGVIVKLSELLPPTLGYYRYLGSLTTPPCTENVHWFVLRETVAVSRAQVARFSALYPHNARPIQPLNGREIRASAD